VVNFKALDEQKEPLDYETDLVGHETDLLQLHTVKVRQQVLPGWATW
jgi:hypothetical protein